MLAALPPGSASRHVDRRFHRMHATLAVSRGIRMVWVQRFRMTICRNYFLCYVFQERVLPRHLSLWSMVVDHKFLALLAESLVHILVCCVPQEREIVVSAEMWFLTRYFRLVESGEPQKCLCVLLQSEIETPPRKDNFWI